MLVSFSGLYKTNTFNAPSQSSIVFHRPNAFSFEVRMHSFQIPGTHHPIEYEVDVGGELMRLRLAGIDYIRRHGDTLVFAGDWHRYREQRWGQTLYRLVESKAGRWVETYVSDAGGLPSMVDGTRIERNAQGEVIACSYGAERWHYHYQDGQLIGIDGPQGQTNIHFGSGQKPASCQTPSQNLHFDYNREGLRKDTPIAKKSWHRDHLGRLWTITNSKGEISTTYLWWGFACLARIDGPPGDPLAAIFSLDATGTPVRMTTPNTTKRFIRDAFGMNLLQDPSVPGLFGGAQDGPFFHYRARVIDPSVGSFTAPDPFDGGATDPRRSDGFHGGLPVERPPGGPYCICQNDPIGRFDPTGEISAGVGSFLSVLSSTTWAFQNNMTGLNLLGTWNILLSLLSFNGKVIGALGDVETVSSPYTGSWGVRANPSGLELLGINRRRIWAMQHTLWGRNDEFDAMARARVFVPDSRFEPKLYGSLLWLRPNHGHQPKNAGIDFVLSGSQSPFASLNLLEGFSQAWTRSGGIGEPIFPGSTFAWFPEGGLHFAYRQHVPCPVEGTIAEIFPNGEVYLGKAKSRLVIITDDLETTPKKGDILLTDQDDHIAMHVVRGSYSEQGKTHFVMEGDDPDLKHHLVDLYDMALDPNPETLKAGSQTDRLDGAAGNSDQHYQKGDKLRVAGGLPEVIAARKIKALEAKLTLDAAPPATTGDAPFQVFAVGALVHEGKVPLTNKSDLVFPEAGPKPEDHDYIVLEHGETRGVYQLSQGANEHTFTTDRDIDSTLVNAGKSQWYLATRLTVLGVWDGVINGQDLVLETETSGQAPSEGPILFKNDDDDIFGARNVTALVFDELVLNQDLPGGQVDHSVTKIDQGDCLESDAYLADRTVLAIEEPPARLQALAQSPLVHLLPLDAPSIVDGNSPAVINGTMVLEKQSWDGNKLKITAFTNAEFPLSHANTHAPIPGQVVILRQHGSVNTELTVAKKLSMTITFDRTPTFQPGFVNPPDGWNLVPLSEQGLYFKGSRKNNDEIVLETQAYAKVNPQLFGAPIGNIRSEEIWLPRFQSEQLVKVIWGKAGVQGENIYRLEWVHGAALKVVGGPPIPAGQDHYAVIAMDARPSSNRLPYAGIEGHLITPTQYRFDIWEPSGLWLGAYAITIKNQTAPVVVTSFNQLDIEFFKTPAMAGNDVDIVIARQNGLSVCAAHHHIVEDEWLFPNLPILPGTRQVLVQSFTKPDDAAHQQGNFSSGTARIPHDESSSFELDARQSLETHELQHTMQSLILGPILLTMVPHFLFQIGALASGDDLDTAEFSAFVDGSFIIETGTRLLQIGNPQGIEFASGRTVQLVQNANVFAGKLGGTIDGSFRLINADGLSPGQVAVRLERRSTTGDLAKASAWMEVFSIGGLQSTLIGPLLNLLPWSIAQIVHACHGDPAGRFLQPDYFPATVPNPENPFQVELGTNHGDSHDLAIHDKVEVIVDGNRDCHTVVAVAGNLVSLDTTTRFSGPNRDLRIGKIGENHPMKSVVSLVNDTFGTRDLRWFFDPLGQLFYEVDENESDGLDWALAILRPFYSTTAWSGIPLLGAYWLDIVYTTAFGESYYSKMEQDAANMSGRMYSPAGRIRGDLSHVGDLASYYYYHDQNTGARREIFGERVDAYEFKITELNLILPLAYFNFRIGDEVEIRWRTGDDTDKQAFLITKISKDFSGIPHILLALETVPGLTSIGGIPDGFTTYSLRSDSHRNHDSVSLMFTGLGDAIGLPSRDLLRVSPFRADPGEPPGPEPNLAANSPQASSQALPHQLFLKKADAPLAPLAGDPASYPPSQTGTIPTTANLERSSGMYVAFSQPSNQPHRITTSNGFSSGSAKGRIAEDICGGARQRLIYDLEIKDVELFHSDQKLETELQLVYCQSAKLRLEPSEKRNYELTVADPEFDDIARNAGTMAVLAQTKSGSTHIEIARMFDGHSPPTHLNQPFYVPVRKVKISVSDTLTLREEALPEANGVQTVEFGTPYYLLVPAKLTQANLAAHEHHHYPIPPPAGVVHPQSGIAPVSRDNLEDATKSFIGAGKVYRVEFKSDDPPEEAVDIQWDIEVEAGQTFPPHRMNAMLQCSVKLNPNFRLTHAGGNYEVAQVKDSQLVLTTDPGNVLLADEVLISSTTIADPKFNVSIANDRKSVVITTLANTAKGTYQILVSNEDESDQKARRTFSVV